MILQEPFGWVWEVQFKDIQKQKISTTGNTKYYTAANTQQQEDKHLLVNNIADAIVDNELASHSQQDYSTDQLAQAIKQKYYPPANDNQINSMLSTLAERIDRIATITNHHSPDVQVTMWQSRNRYNYLHGIADDDEASWHRYRPRI